MPIAPTPPLLFSDVDGTLIDRAYRRMPSSQQLEHIAGVSRLILVSSRTIEELRHLLDMWGVTADCIAENGALIATRDEALASALGAEPDPDAEGWWIRGLAASRDETLQATRRVLESAGLSANPVDTLPLATFAGLSGYAVDDALRARSRRHAVLLMPLPARALDALRAAGLEAEFGGRWVTVLHGANKGRAVAQYLDAWHAIRGAAHTVGIGDAPNDASLLQAVQLRFAMPRDDGSVDPSLTALDGVIPLPVGGTDAWEAVLQSLDQAHADV